jgi:phosphotriesterase-related protein
MSKPIHSYFTRRQAVRLIGVAGINALSAGETSGRVLAAQISFPEGAVIRTILTDLSPDALAHGPTLFHEHLDGVYSRETRQFQLPPPSSADIAPVVEDVETAMRSGVVCIVDGGHPDMGVNYEHLRQISAVTGLHVVASGGYYLRNTYPGEISSMSDDQIAARLVAEANAGRFGAYGEIGYMAGRAEFFADELKVFRAVGKAHLQNNLPIFTHNSYGSGPDADVVPRDMALRQLNVYESVGVDPSRVAIGHMDSLPGRNADIIIALAERGAFVGLDRIRGDAGRDEARVALVLDFLSAGHVDRLLLSSDTRSDFLKVARFTEQLQRAGVSEVELQTIMVDNPRRFLAFVPRE